MGAGPAAGGILADWGAEVVKIEPPAGDPSRTFQYSLTGQMMPTNPIFEMDNRSKRSIVLDLTTPEGKEIADDLIAALTSSSPTFASAALSVSASMPRP